MAKKKSGPVGIHVDGSPRKEVISAVAAGIETILKAGYTNHTEQETIRLAIASLSQLTKIENISISNCSIGVGGSSE